MATLKRTVQFTRQQNLNSLLTKQLSGLLYQMQIKRVKKAGTIASSLKSERSDKPHSAASEDLITISFI
ncbi:hypothetical protein PCANC_11742 [Puccinia coronata f. sp. avenae]|uniref:Uncharacterized protein n=1 Tax=Puccinia coronata f. sp. avenae TaxID=200324 RepID=A0A2N5UY28_9BASI|nr:hypothetical protein PCANC_11742 [Puccinia coronata f. sp. avenae]